MKKILVIVNSKGGVGKSVLAHQILPSVFEQSCSILEIDNNNRSGGIYNQSSLIESESIKADAPDLFTRVNQALVKMYREQKPVIVDAGGGDDSAKVLNAILSAQIPAIYLIPVSPDPETVDNFQKTKNLIIEQDPKAQIFAIFNNLTKEIENEYWFIFGKKSWGIKDQTKEILKQVAGWVEIRRDSTIGLAKMYSTTIGDLAQISKSRNFHEERLKWIQEGMDDAELAKQFDLQNMSVDCRKFIDSFQNQFAPIVKSLHEE